MPVVVEPSAPVAARQPLEVRGAQQVRNAAVLPVLCSLTSEPIRSCQVVASVVVDGRVVVVGRGSAHLDGRPSAHKVAVPVELNDQGRALLGLPGGTGLDAMTMTLEAVVHGVDSAAFTTSQLHRLGAA